MSYFHFRSSQLAINLGMDLLSMCGDMFSRGASDDRKLTAMVAESRAPKQKGK